MTAAVPLILPAPAPLSIVVEFVALRFGEGCVVNLVGGLRTALPRPDVHFDAREFFVSEDVKTSIAAAVRGDDEPEIRGPGWLVSFVVAARLVPSAGVVCLRGLLHGGIGYR